MPNQAKLDQVLKVDEFLRFIEWISLPTSEREPKTQVELAGKLKVDIATLSDWKKVDGFWDEVRSKRKEWGQNKVSNVLLGLYGRALTGTAAEVKLFLQYVDEFVEKSQLISQGELSEEDKKLMKKAIDYAQGIKGEDSKGSNISKVIGD